MPRGFKLTVQFKGGAPSSHRASHRLDPNRVDDGQTVDIRLRCVVERGPLVPVQCRVRVTKGSVHISHHLPREQPPNQTKRRYAKRRSVEDRRDRREIVPLFGVCSRIFDWIGLDRFRSISTLKFCVESASAFL